MSKIDWNKPVRTKDGRPVRILCTNRESNDYPVVGLIKEGDEEKPAVWMRDGKRLRNDPSPGDLENTPEKHTGWVNLYSPSPNHSIGYHIAIFETKAEADEGAFSNRMACIKIEFEDGEGLDDPLSDEQEKIRS